MPYLNRHTTKKSALSAELLYLLVVLAAGVATAWWAGHKVGIDLSGVRAAASILGLTDTGRLTHGAVGYSAAVAQTRDKAQADQPVAAPYCAPGQTPAFALGIGGLKQRLGDTMGTPVECEHAISPIGDTVQQTTTGLAAYNMLSNTVTFTDGWRHWAVTPGGFVAWEGADPNPPPG